MVKLKWDFSEQTASSVWVQDVFQVSLSDIIVWLLSSLHSKVSKEILKVMQERMTACTQREGTNSLQNCIKETQQYEEVAKNFELCCKSCAAKKLQHI